MFQPRVRREWGVYFTPRQIVQAQVALTAEVLRTRLGCPAGFADDRVLIVDPACGDGVYPLAIVDDVGPAVKARMRLFEVLPEAAALARARGLHVEQRDALSVEPTFNAEILVCLGNPPYRRTRGGEMSVQLLDGFASAPGVHRKNLFNNYVYFWRWALRATFQQRVGAGVVCLVTAGSYLRGPAFAGMRQLLREVLDELWIIDLEGDERAARASNNVFPIRTPVAIALGVRIGGRGSARGATVHYTCLHGTAKAKLATLEQFRALETYTWRPVATHEREPFVPRPASAYFAWPALTELFPWQLSGAQLKRTWPIAATPDLLRVRWRHFLELPHAERDVAFGRTRDRDLDSAPLDLFDPTHRLRPLAQLTSSEPCPEPVRYAYRPFDRQWVLADARVGDFLRPALWHVHGPRQVFLTSMLTNVVGAGPAALATGLVPDLDHFRGSFGARGVIPLWCDAAATRPNVSADWLRVLSDCYGHAVTPPTLMAYCYALLATRGYVERFEDELRTPGPRVPVTSDQRLFARGVELGERLLALHTYQNVSRQCARLNRPVGSMPTEYAFGDESLWVGDGEFGPVPENVWRYSVSGYRVVANWLRRRISPRPRSVLDRIGVHAWTETLTDELLQLLWLLEATIAIEPELDAVLDEIVSGPRVTGPIRRR